MDEQLDPTAQQETPPADPREALNLKKAQIQLLEAELSEVDATLDAEFIDNVEKYLSPEELEMRFEDDVRPFLSALEEKKEAFYREKLDELRGKINTLKTEAQDEEESLDIDDAKRAFLEAHPEADWAAVTDFFHNDMTARQKEELVGLDTLAMMEAVYAAYSKKNKSKPSESTDVPSEGEQLPPDLNDAPASAPVGDPSPAAKDEGYLARIGVRR